MDNITKKKLLKSKKNHNKYKKSKKIENFKNKGCFKKILTKKDLECYNDLLKILSSILSKHKIDWIPICGSLLSLYRHTDIIIPWDADYDITVKSEDVKKTLEILKNEAPKHNCNFSFVHSYNDGDTYKFFMEKKCMNYKYKNTIKKHNNYFRQITENADTFNWPYIDVFVNVNDKKIDRSMGAYNLHKSEYPLKSMNVRGINIKYPTRGIRSYDYFKKKGYFDNCVTNTWNHKKDLPIFCLGEKKIKCNRII